MLTDRFCFVHIPRMGGSAFKELCADVLTPIVGHTGHLTGPEMGWIAVPRVALLRDPWSWYRSMLYAAAIVGPMVRATYAATVLHYLRYPDGRSQAVDHVYCWPWRLAVTALLRDHGYAPEGLEPLERYRAIRASPPAVPGVPREPDAHDLTLWRAYGGAL